METSFHTLTFGPATISTQDNYLISIDIINDPSFVWAELELNDFNKKSKYHQSIVEKCLSILDGANSKVDFELSPIGSDFQKKVWKAISGIPYGKTASYSDIARAIKLPKSFRAIGSACAANSIAVIIPCHRVITKDGKLGEYKWGADLKKKFLDRET